MEEIQLLSHSEFFEKIQNKEWEIIMSYLWKHKNDIERDPVFTHASQVFLSEFFKDIENYDIDNKAIENSLYTLWMIHVDGYYILNDSDFDRIITELAKRKQNRKEEAYRFAIQNPENIICKEIIKNFEKDRPQNITHSQSDKIKLTKTNNVSSDDYTRSFFFSNQEEDFFHAVRFVFPTYHVYPNVAIKSIIDNSILEKLSSEEKDLFFTGLIDCVVVDHHNEYKPKYCIELDSKYHDDDKQKKKDKIKDDILSIAGLPIYRIRKKDINVGMKEFTVLIREQIEGNNDA